MSLLTLLISKGIYKNKVLVTSPGFKVYLTEESNPKTYLHNLHKIKLF